jgi:hypothetical protein
MMGWGSSCAAIQRNPGVALLDAYSPFPCKRCPVELEIAYFFFRFKALLLVHLLS